MATLKDVARLACVDVSTVSRALNNTSYVHPDTKKKIYEAAKAVGYHPNVIAKALRQGKRHTIGVVIPRLHLTIFSEILQGIEAEARKLGYATMVCSTEDDPQTEKECLDRLRNGFVDGIILAATGKNSRLIRDIKAGGMPIVQLVRMQERAISSIVADYEACGYEAVTYLYEKGCRNIGLIAGAQHLEPYRGRYKGYHKAVKQLGLKEYLGACDQPVNSFEYGYECTNQLLDEADALDAIIACVDVQGIGALRVLKERNIASSEVKVISLTGHEIGGMLTTSMTSMEMPAHEMGKKAASMIIEEIEAPLDQKPSPQHLVFSATLMERESTGPDLNK
ncbi:MAG: LacI family DNA-binding transcriptional regulator [Lachnospiraceae bacterium]